MTTDLLERFRRGDRRALSRFISLAENKDPIAAAMLAEIYPHTGRARVIGFTGAPGAGKSTLVNRFVHRLRAAKKTVAVVAVDPVSPFSGGALLGDRIRLNDHFNDPDVFIRSLSTRGKLGGLSLATREVVHIADAFGIDYILLETVGVGQSEVDVRRVADVTLVMLVPEWGDGIQAIKSGILEIGDVFAVNKADREGADRVVTELKNMLQMAGRDTTPVLATSMETGREATVTALLDALDGFFTNESALVTKRRAERGAETAVELLRELAADEARDWVARRPPAATNPYRFLVDFRKQHPEGTLFGI